MAGLVYVPHKEKHKEPKGYGSLCQKSVSTEHAQELLARAVPHPDRPATRALFAACGEAVFVARPTRFEAGEWHGYPELGSRIDPAVLDALETAGHLDARRRRRVERQRELPARCGCP